MRLPFNVQPLPVANVLSTEPSSKFHFSSLTKQQTLTTFTLVEASYKMVKTT